MPQPGEQVAPFCVNVHVTPLLVPSFVVAVNCCVAFTATLAELGDTATEIGTSIMEALVLARVFFAEVAAKVNPPFSPGGIGEVAGAV